MLCLVALPLRSCLASEWSVNCCRTRWRAMRIAIREACGCLLRFGRVRWKAKLRAGQSCDANRCGACIHKSLAAGARGGAGGENVVNEQDVAIPNGGRIDDKKSATQILAALAGSQSGLTLGSPLPHERGWRQLEPPLGMRLAQNADGLDCEVARLVKAALGLAKAMERHRHDQELCGRSFVDLRSHLRDGGGEACAQFTGERCDALEFEGVYGAAQ